MRRPLARPSARCAPCRRRGAPDGSLAPQEADRAASLLVTSQVHVGDASC